MEKKNNNGKIVGILIGIIIMLIIGAGLFATGTINFKSNTGGTQTDNSNDEGAINNTNNNNNDIKEVIFNDEKISISNISQESIFISSAGIESIYPLYNYNIDLKVSGKVKITTIGMSQQNSNEYSEEFITNVDNVIDIIEFGIAGTSEEQLIYMLQSNGDVYYYKVGDSIEKKYVATKVDGVSNVKKLFIYNYPPKKNAGGSWSIVAIKENNETVALNTESV